MKKFIIKNNVLKEYIGSDEIVHVPNDVKTIGMSSFSSNNKTNSFGGVNVKFMYSQVKEIILPESVTAISKEAFKNCKYLKQIKLPNSILKINNAAFSFCRSLETIILPNCLVELSDNLFFEASNLNDVTFPDNLEKIGYRSFYSCENLTNISLPSSLKLIDEEAFINCKNLKELIIPEGVETIGTKAFSNCINLESVTLPSTLKVIGKHAFASCHKLTNVNKENIPADTLENVFSGTKININSDEQPEVKNTSVLEVITESKEVLIEVKKQVSNFNDTNSQLAYKYIEYLNPQKPRNILEEAYKSKMSMPINEPVTSNINVDSNGLIVLNSDVLLGTTKSDSILHISEGIKVIEENSFNSNEFIKVLILPSSIEEIKNKAFYNCSSLEMIVFSNTVPTLGEEVFTNTNVRYINYKGLTTVVSNFNKNEFNKIKER